MVLAVAACTTAGGSPSSRTSGTSLALESPSAAPTASSEASPSPSGTATNEGLSLSISLDRTSVVPGGEVTITATVRNNRSTPVVYEVSCDLVVTATATLPLPLEPIGKTWTGAANDLKLAALGLTPGTGETPDQVETDALSATPGSCFQGEQTLAAGATIADKLVWSAELASGVPALPGDVTLSVAFAHDRLNGPPSYPPGSSGLVATWIPEYTLLTATTHIEIVGPARALLSKGQVVDALLSDPRFENWMTDQPGSTWSQTNLLLQDFGAGTTRAPAGASWEIDVSGSRGRAAAFVNPFSGAVTLNLCTVPATWTSGVYC
jgi:hypothetical protein